METSTPRRLLTPRSDLSRLEDIRSHDSTPLQCAVDLLELLSPRDRVFESAASSVASSVVSIPFSDAVLDECVRKEAARDRKLVSEEIMAFSPPFKKAMAECKEAATGLTSVTSMMAEDPSTILQGAQRQAELRRTQPGPEPSPVLAKAFQSLSRDIREFRPKHREEPPDSDSYEEDESDEDDAKDEGGEKTAKPRSRKASKPVISAAKKAAIEDPDFYDTSSGMWKMLAAYDGLVLSQPGYKDYRQDEEKDLCAEPVQWGVMEVSRSKCEEWLSKQHVLAGN